MVVGRLRRTLKRGLSIAMAAALMVTSVPLLSVTSMAQEERDIVRQDETDESISEEVVQGETEEGKSPSGDSTESVSAEEDTEDAEETQMTSAEQSDEEDGSKETEMDTEAEEEDGKDPEQDETEDESDAEEDEKKNNDSDKTRAGDEIEGKVIYQNNFDSETEDSELAGGTVKKLADGNMAIEYAADLSQSEGKWTDIFQAELAVSPDYTDKVNEKMTMSFDIYFPKGEDNSTDGSGEDGDDTSSQAGDDSTTVTIGKMAVKAVLKTGDASDWTEGSNGLSDLTDADLVDAEIDGYSKAHVELDMSSETGWTVADITSIRSVIPCLAGNGSTYKGKVYLDNVVLKDTSSGSGSEEPDEPDQPDTEEVVVYKNDFDSVAADTNLANGTVKQLADGNMAIWYDVDLSQSTEWTNMFQADSLQLEAPYDASKVEKMVMSYDVYFPDGTDGDNTDDIGTVKAQAVLRDGGDWGWRAASANPPYTNADLESDAIEGFRKLSVSVEIEGGSDWEFSDLDEIKAITPCLAGDVSTYQGEVYLDNVVLKVVSFASEENPPVEERDLIYENNFDSETDASVVEEADNKEAELVTLADGNKAIKFTANLSESEGWADIFKAQINLSEEYAKAISQKVVMSYDVYFPENSINADFGTMKAQAVLKSGADWTWITQQSWPGVSASELTDSRIEGYKVFHVEIDMDNFKTADGEEYPFEKITPIKTVVPCLAGEGSKYAGDVYLDNLEVWAVNESGSDIPPVEGDLVLELDASAWKVCAEHYQYTGSCSIDNQTVNDTKFLAVTMDYTNDSDMTWSEAKFEYTHPETVASLRGYNAFKADIYYKPADMTAGSFSIKLFSDSPKIDQNTALPAGEPVDIPGLEGYYKAEYTLNLRIPSGAFQNLTFGMVGKSTDFKGDIYFSNMRFTQVVEEDIYVDSTILPKKGSGIQVVDDGRSIQTASGNKVAIAETVALVDANADEATKNLYAYLQAVGKSDSVIFGHQNDTHHKAGSAGDDFTTSDTKDLTGSIAGVVGIDALSLTGNEALTWDASEADRINHVAEITREAASEGALVTLSAHMPNFDVIDKRVKAYDESNQTGNDSNSVGYWVVGDDKQYNFSGYTPGTLTGNVVSRVMPGQDLNYLYTDYLDLIADYAKAVENDGITILFRPLHENTGSWFWWGAALCDEQAYIALYRYTVDYLKETKKVHNMLYVYGPGSEAANVTEYAARYPGDDYVDMIGYDLYHSNPSPENEASYLQSIRKQNEILKEFAQAHNKLYAITETGVADQNADGEGVALQRTGNKVMDWYEQLLDEISDSGVCYFLVWANFSENGSFYLPYAVEQLDNGYLHGHEMMDNFITFYNDGRSVFATDMNSEFKQISGVTNTTKAGAVSGYFLAPQSGDRLLTGNADTRIAAVVSGDIGEEKVQFIAAAGDKQVVLEAALNQQNNTWEAFMTDEELLSLGEIPGTITLKVGEKEIAFINARFNLKAPVQDDMVPEDFESYAGSNRELNSAWPTNKASGSEISLVLTQDEGKVFGGKYGMQMNITLADRDAWVGATKSFEADWSQGNALELYTIPEAKGQHIVVQVKSGGEEFEVYLQNYEDYLKYAAEGTPVKVTIPFSAFVGKKNGVFQPDKIEVIGLWCNALPNENVTYPLSTTICYDELRVVTTEQTAVQITSVSDIPPVAGEVTGNIITPQSGDRILPDAQNPNTRLVAKVSGVDTDTADIRFVAKTVFDEVVLKAAYNAEAGVWEALLEDSALQRLSRTHGTIALIVNEKVMETVTVKFNMEEMAGNPMVPEDFEGYAGSSQDLGTAWVSGQTPGSGVALSLTDDKEKVTGGNYALEMNVTLADKDAWAGVTKNLDADWSAGNALEFDTIPVADGQRIAVQVISGGRVFEVYLQDIDGYAGGAVYGIPAKVTIPFGAFVARDDKSAVFDPSQIEGIGLWCGAPAQEGTEFPLSATLYYDEFKVVTTERTTVNIDVMARKGIWVRAIPDQTYTGKAIKPDIQVYDDAALLTLKKDYTVSYKNNTKAGTADVIIKGKGNYSDTITEHFEIKQKDISELTITATEYLIYNGKDQSIAVTVKDGNKKLGTKNDYTQVITYNNGTGDNAAVQKAKEEGTYSIRIVMKETGNYTGEITLTCKVVKDKELLSKASVTLPAKALDYNDGNPVVFEDESQIVVKLKGKVIPQKESDDIVNYRISYENHRQVGTASVVITADENSKYVGSVRKTFAVKGKTFSAGAIDITGFEAKMPYTGKTIYQSLTLKDKADASGKPLEENVDYKITYLNNRNAGKAAVTLTGLGKYSGTIKKTFAIDKAELKADMVQTKELTVLQSRAGVTPDVEIVFDGRTLVRDRDYKLTYTNNKNTTSAAKKAWIHIVGAGNFKGSLKNAVELKINPKSWDDGGITVEVPDMKYSAKKAQYTPVPVVYDNGAKLTKNKDYTVSYASNTKEEIGEITASGHMAQAVITLTGADYQEKEGAEPKRVEFRIIGKLISEAKVKIAPAKQQYYSQYGTRPAKDDLEVTYKGQPVTADQYEIISHSANDKKGKATLVIRGIGEFGGTKKVTYTINARNLKENFAKELAEALAEISAPLIEQLQ